MAPRFFRISGYYVLLTHLLFLASASTCAAQGHTLVVEYFDPGSNAQRAGVMPGDSVLSYDGQPLISPATLLALEANTFGKTRITLEVERDGQRLRFAVPPGPLGMTVSLLLPDEARMLYIESWRALQSEDLEMGINKTRAAAKMTQDKGDYLGAAWIWWTQGNRLGRIEKWAEACQAYATALKLLENTNDVAARSRAFSALGNCSLKLNAFAKAQEWYEKALQLDKTSGYQGWAAGDLTQIARAALMRADLGVARDYTSRARMIYERLAPNSYEHAGVLNNLGEISLAYGHLKLAQGFFTDSLRIKAGLERDPETLLSLAGTVSNLAGVALARGDFVSARDYILKSLEIRQDFLPDDSPDIAANLVNLGNVYHVTEDLNAAEEHFNRALAIYEKSRPKSSVYAYTLSNLGNVAYDKKNYQAAKDNHARALAILQPTSPNSLDVAKVLGNLGNTYYAVKNLSAARQHYDRAIAIYRRLAPASLDLALNLNNFGTLALSENNLPEAVRLFSEAVEIIESQRRQIPATEARGLLINQRLSEYTGLLRAHIRLNDLPSAFAVLERARARSLTEMIFESSLESTADAPDELLRKQREVIEQRNASYYQLSRLDPGKNLEEIESLRRRIESLVLQQRRLTSEIRERSPRYASLQYPEPLDLTRAQQALDEGTLLLSYFVDEEQVYLFIVTKAGIRLHKDTTPRDRLCGLVDNFRFRIAKRGIDFRGMGRELYDRLIKPAQVEIDQAERILISPHGCLNALAFAALEQGPAPQSQAAESGPKYLIKAKPLHKIVSIGVYTGVRKRERAAGRDRADTILALGDPVYSGQKVLVGCGRQQESLDPLPYTRKQVMAIGALFGERAIVKLDKDATVSALESGSAKANILHFAGHGILDNCDPYASALALTRKGDGDNGLLRAYDVIERFRFNADLVTLSACQTGEGEQNESEGVIGLTRAFQYAGARSVLVSLWNIREDSTAQLMESFYKNLRSAQSKDEALRQAQLTLINSEQHSHPYFWAAFLLAGDWQ